MAPSEPEPSWAIEQARYLMSETMESALRRRPDADPMRAEVAQVLSTLGGQILAEGAQGDARRACEAAVAHLRLVRQADRQASGDLARALYNLGIVRLEEQVSEGRAAAAGHAYEALRLVVSGPEPSSEADVEMLAAVASMAAEADVELIDPGLVADLGATAERCVRWPSAATEICVGSDSP